ncbi:MAG TPA: DUF929 family protein [Candidatus Dormibacteraeota bacterium]|nr:DUF929 family protein [Candidatus Dormibacteraeota bacterium]
MASTKRGRPMRKPVSQRPAWLGPVAIVAGVALIIAAFFVIRWYLTPQPPKPLNSDATQAVLAKIASLPQSEFDAVGQGAATNSIKAVSGTPLTGPSGRPMVFYYGAEFCPYCAAERWPIIIALSRFGTFTGLQTTSSSSTDVYPNTPTFTFRGATYTSQYVEFESVETTDRNQNPLQTPTAAQQQIVSRYDSSGVIPFVDFGNRYEFTGATYLPDKLGGMSWQAVADALQDQGSPQAQAVVGSANLITAAVCKLTGDQPAAVCSSTSIQGLERKLG